jgi:hypothetical protein
MSERGRAIGFDDGGFFMTLRLPELKLLTWMLRDVADAYWRTNRVPLSSECSDLIREIENAPRVATLTIRSMRGSAHAETLASTGTRGSVLADGLTSVTMDVVAVTSREVCSLAKARGVRVSESHVRRCLAPPVDRVGNVNRYSRDEAEAFIAKREVAA